MSKAGFKTAAVPQCLWRGGDDAWGDERATDPLHRAGIDSEAFGNDAHTGPSRSRQWSSPATTCDEKDVALPRFQCQQ